MSDETVDISHESMTVPGTQPKIVSPTLPPVGSLWRHKYGERRCVLFIDDLTVWFYYSPINTFNGTTPKEFPSISDWLSWQSDADRIDIEPATAPRGQEE